MRLNIMLANGIQAELRGLSRDDVFTLPPVLAGLLCSVSTLKVYLHREPVDGRKNINGLALLVEGALGLDLFAPTLFVFSDRIKILLWEHTEFWLMLKCLDDDRFK